MNRNENFIYIVHFEHFDLLSISQTDLIAIGYFSANSLNLNRNENLIYIYIYIYSTFWNFFDLLSISQTDSIAIGYFTVNSLNLKEMKTSYI